MHRAPHVMSVSELHELPSANIGSNLPEGNFKAPSKNLRLASPLMFCYRVRFFFEWKIMEHPKEYSETGNISQRITEALDLTLSGLGYSTRVS